MSESGHTTPRDNERKQSLVNKCLNERRRRDQENHYFEELAEIITASLTDMSSTFSVKPEKCAILQETVKQIKQIKQGNSGGGDSAVQQSQVSSSKPAILADDILGPLLLEALDGFLFVVNSQGKVEFVSENVTQFIKYTQDDLIGKSVYNIIHVGDHAQFSNNLLPMSSGGIGGINWPSDNLCGKGRVFNCRLLIKPSCNDNDDLETKQTYVHQYESLQISSILHPSDTFSENSESNDSSSSLVCIARRLPLAEKTNTMLGVEQFTTKQDLNGKIIGCDISGIAPERFNCPDFVGQNIQEFCHTNDIQQLSKHLQETVKNGSNTSGVYRFKMQENRFAFVQTKSKLFQNPISGSSEFIMSTHSLIRECDSDNELKGSASTSLMKSIIGPSLQQTLQKAQTPISNVNTSMASMALVGNNVMSGNLFSVNNNSNDDFFSQLGWDTNLGDSSVSSTGNSFMNSTNQSVANTTTSSFSNSWSTQLKLSQVQQHLQRSLSSSTQRTQMTGSNNMSVAGNKRPSNLVGPLGPRSTSIDLGQVQGQGQIPQPQKSPGFSQSPGPMSRSGGFQIPSQRGVVGYNRRSPAASPVPGIGQGNFNTPFSPRTPSPMLSPSPGLNQTGWGHQSMAGNPAQSGHHQYEDQSSYTHERLLQHLTGLEGITGDKKIKRSGRLCELLTQKSPPSSSMKSEPGTPKSGRSRHNSRQGYVEMSPADSIQSPQPGPGQSPPEKPQSTSNDDGEHLVHTENKESNRLLKSLLSRDDDTEDDEMKDDNSASKNEQTAEAQAVPQKPVSSVEMEKNEAEAKKPNNVLLKQLLSTDEGECMKDSTSSEGNKSIIHKLLDDNKDDCRSVPAESTSIDSELARHRHQSGPQEPQSTTTHSQPMPPLSSPLTSPVTPNFSTNMDTSLLKGLFSSSSGLSMNQAMCTTTSVFALTNNSIDSVSTNAREGHATRDKKIDKLLHLLWEDNSNDGTRMRERIQNLKRKADMLETSESEQNAFSGELTSSQASRLAKENALLTQLLSKKANNDIVVNTLSTIQPSGIPQQRIPPNLASKLLKVNPSSFMSASSSNEAKRARTESGNNNQLSTLEKALSAPKQDLNSISSTQSFDALLDIGPNSNSGISNISDSSVTSQFNNQFSELQQILQATVNEQGNSTANITEVNLDDNTDPLLAQILQQAQDLQQDITSGSFPSSNQNVPHNIPLESGLLNNSAQALLNHSNLTVNTNLSNNNNSYQKNNTSSDLLQQLEQALNESNFNLNDLDSLLGNSNTASMDEQVAIDAIQKQLMMDMPGMSSAGPASNIPAPNTLDSGRIQGRYNQSLPVPSPSAGSQMQQNMLGNQQGRLQGPRGQFQNLGSMRQGLGGPARPNQQLPGYSQATAAGQSFPGQGPRLPHPQGALPSPTQQQRPMFSNANPNSTAMQVRQSLLQQQKLKQMRERNKQHIQQQQQQQDRQKLLMQQQQRSQFSPQYSTQRVPQDNLSMGGNNVIPQFPENLAELMNSGTAPNVTLQRNQIPGPMSPRYQTLPGQPPQSPSVGSMLPPNPQLSPNFSQTQQQQWNARQGQTNIGMSTQGTAQYNNRHRSLSGGTLQTSPPQSFAFSDSQFTGNQQLGNLYSQQQQQQQQQHLYQQNRGGQLQRQLSRGGSPRGSQSPFGPNSDPLLMSPHNISPKSMRPPQQVSPSYNQGGMVGTFGQGSMASQPSSLPSPQYTQNHSQGQMGMNAHSMDLDLNSLFDSNKKPLDVPLSVSTPGSSKTIKEELRNFCNARSQNTLQGQSSLQSQSFLHNSSLPSQSSLQSQMMAAHPSHQFMSPNQQQQPQQQQQQSHHIEQDIVSELPLDILEQINEMTQDHGINHPEYKEEIIMPKKREEAKNRYVKFQQLANSEDPDSKATNLFRKQLASQTSGQTTATTGSDSKMSMYTEPKPSSVNIVQSEPRTPIEEIKPANQKDSLLQQLLSD